MINVRNITKYVLISVLVLCANFLLAQNTVSLNIKDMPVRDVITNLMAQSDVNIIMTDDARMDKKIRINLSDCDLEKALNYIMQASGLSFKKVDDNTYIIGGSATDNGLNSLFSPESLLNSVNSKVVDSDNELSSVPSNKGIRDVKVIELQHVGATELLKTLGYYDGPSANVYNNVDTFKTHNARIKYQDNGQISVPSINPYINDGSGRTAELDTLSGQWGGVTGGSTSGRSSRSSSGSGYGSSYNNNGYSNNGSGSSGGSFGGSISFLDPYFQSDPTTGYNYFDSIVPYDLNNSIMVRGDSEAIKQFQRDLSVFDIPPRQVEVKCEFVEIYTVESKAFGIDWAIGRTGRNFYTTFFPAGTVWFDFANGNLEATVTAEMSQSVGKLVNAPIISTLNNLEGSISFTKTVPKFTSSVSGDGVNPIATYSSNDVSVSTDLYVTPRINRDNSITMIIEANIGDIVDYVQSPDGKSSSPSTIDQTVNTVRRIYDGETVVIGGLIRQNQDHDVTKIPILGDLPIIGQFFRSESLSKDDTELLIFVTPRIIHDSINMNKLIN